MNKQRLRDVALGFLFCLALVGSYYCGASASPTNTDLSDEEIKDLKKQIDGLTAQFS